jgi:catechol 2,3-dioxygenase-like lactoylglutathione lyase family enzyme
MHVDYGPFTALGTGMAAAFGLRATETRKPFGVDTAAFLRYSQDEEEVVVDLGWWHRPKSTGAPYARPHNVGHQRTGIRVPDAGKVHDELAQMGIAAMSAPLDLDLDGHVNTFCLRNPDGVGVQVFDTPESRSDSDRRIKFISITVRDLEVSLPFYRDVLGMGVVRGPFDFGGPDVGRLYGLSGHKSAAVRGVWLRPGDLKDGTLIELLEWQKPASDGHPYGRYVAGGGSYANHIGIVRIAFNVDGYQQVYDSLVGEGVQFVSAPQITDIGPDVAYCCFEDPDGSILQLYEYVRGTEAEYQN